MSISTHKFEYKHLLKRFGSIWEVGGWIREYVNLHGLIILHGLESEFDDLGSAKLFFTKLSSSVGTLVPHNYDQSDFVWEIKPKLSTSIIQTFSEHNKDAPLHTDSQYRNIPEKYMVLLAFRQADCGGGKTIFLDFKNILNELRESIYGREIIKFASQNKFPIAVPSIFQAGEKTEFIYSSLISNVPLIRYRYDTFKTGGALMKNWYIEDFDEKLNALDNVIQKSLYISNFFLNNGEAIFIDNHRILHGRSSFVDSNRLLLRIRIN